MADVKFEKVTTTLPTSTGSFAVNAPSGFGTPVACIILWNSSATLDTASASGRWAIGFYDGTDNVGYGASEWGAQAVTVPKQHMSTTYSLVSQNVSNSSRGIEGRCTSFYDAGVNITLDTAPGSAMAVTIVFIGGADVSNVKAGIKGITTGTTSWSYTGVGFEADVLFMLGQEENTDAANASDVIRYSFGVACNLDGLPQKSTSFASTPNSVSQVYSYVDEAAINRKMYGTGKGESRVLSAFGSDGFTITSDTSAADAGDFMYLAIKFTNSPSFGVVSTRQPTRATYTEDKFNFTPDFVMLGLSNDSDYETVDNSGVITKALTVIDGSGMASVSSSTWAGQTNSYAARAHSATEHIIVRLDSDSIEQTGSTSALTSSGFTIGLDEVSNVMLGWAFGVSGDSYTTASVSAPRTIGIIGGVEGDPIYPVSVARQFAGTELPFTFASTGVSLPSGLSISTSGLISGTVAADATTTGHVITATDANSATADSNEFSTYITNEPTESYTSPNLHPGGTQGYATDGTYHYIISNTFIEKRNDDASWTLVTSNTTTWNSGDLIGSPNHYADGFCYDGYLWVPMHVSPTGLDRQLVRFNLSDLSFYDTRAIETEMASVCFDAALNEIYFCSFAGANITVFDMTTLAFKREVGIYPAIINAQGFSKKNDKFYMLTTNGLIFIVNPDTGWVEWTYQLPDSFDEWEGVDYSQDEFRYIVRESYGSTTKVHYHTGMPTGISEPGGTPVPGSDFDIAVVTFTRPTSGSGTFNVVAPTGFGTPKAAMFICTTAGAIDTLTDHSVLNIGFTDGTTEVSFAAGALTAQSSSKAVRAQRNDCVMMNYSSSTGLIFTQFSFNKWLASGVDGVDGVQLTIDDADTTARECICVLFTGSDLSAQVLDFDDLGTVTTAQSVSVSFEPDVVLFAGVGYENPNTGTNGTAGINFGAAVNDGANTQAGWSWIPTVGVGTTDIKSIIINTGTVLQGDLYRGTVSNFNSGGFDITCNASANADIFGALALKIVNADIALFDASIPTSGNYAEAGIGFEPKFGLLSTIAGPTTRGTQNTTNGAAPAITVFNADDIATATLTSKDNVSTSVEKSFVDTSFKLYAPDGTTVNADAGTSYAFDADGWDFTLATNPASEILGFGIAIGAGGGLAYTLIAGTGSYTSTVNAAGLIASRRLTASVTSCTSTVSDATLTYNAGTPSLVAETVVYTSTVNNASLKASKILAAQVTVYTSTVTDATLSPVKVLVAAPVAYTSTITEVTFTFDGVLRLLADVVTYSSTINAATISVPGRVTCRDTLTLGPLTRESITLTRYC